MHERKIQLVVDYFNGQTRYFPVTIDTGWRIDSMHRMLIINPTKTARTYIPLDAIASFEILEIK